MPNTVAPGDAFFAKTKMRALMSQAEGWLTALLEARSAAATSDNGSAPANAAPLGSAPADAAPVHPIPMDVAAEASHSTAVVPVARDVRIVEAIPSQAAADLRLRIQLPEILDIKAAAPLARELLALRGHPVTIEAAAVQRLGGLCLQVLLSAMETWRRDGVKLSLARPSPSFAEYAELLGAASLFSQCMEEQVS